MPRDWLILLAIAALMVYAAGVVMLIALGRRDDARALAGFIPDCLVLLKRLVVDTRVARRHKALLLAMIVYLAMPFDVVPDFIPVAGQLDDAILVALVLRTVLRGSGRVVIREQRPGPGRSLDHILRLVGPGS